MRRVPLAKMKQLYNTKRPYHTTYTTLHYYYYFPSPFFIHSFHHHLQMMRTTNRFPREAKPKAERAERIYKRESG